MAFCTCILCRIHRVFAGNVVCSSLFPHFKWFFMCQLFVLVHLNACYHLECCWLYWTASIEYNFISMLPINRRKIARQKPNNTPKKHRKSFAFHQIHCFLFGTFQHFSFFLVLFIITLCANISVCDASFTSPIVVVAKKKRSLCHDFNILSNFFLCLAVSWIFLRLLLLLLLSYSISLWMWGLWLRLIYYCFLSHPTKMPLIKLNALSLVYVLPTEHLTIITNLESLICSTSTSYGRTFSSFWLFHRNVFAKSQIVRRTAYTQQTIFPIKVQPQRNISKSISNDVKLSIKKNSDRFSFCSAWKEIRIERL